MENGEWGSIIRDYHDVYKGKQDFSGFGNPDKESQPATEKQEKA